MATPLPRPGEVPCELGSKLTLKTRTTPTRILMLAVGFGVLALCAGGINDAYSRMRRRLRGV